MTETTYWTPHSRFETIPRLYFHPTLTLTTKRSMLSPGFLEICARALLTPRGSRFCPQVIEALGLTSSFSHNSRIPRDQGPRTVGSVQSCFRNWTGWQRCPKRGRPHAIVRFRDGIFSPLCFLVVVHPPAGCGHRPLHSAASELLLDLGHPVSLGGRARLHTGGSDPRCEPSANYISSLSTSTPHSGARAHHPRQSFGG